jgi:hypothetical protein
MQKLTLTLLFGSFLFCASKSGIASSNRRDVIEPCPNVTAWLESHVEISPEVAELNDRKRVLSDPELRSQLLARFERDQIARRGYINEPLDRGRMQRVQLIDVENLEWLKTVFGIHGTLTANQVGESGLIWFWLLVQHADRDPKFQASVLPMFVSSYKNGELDAEYVAKLTDRILLASGKHQMFGTQFDWVSGAFKPRNPGDTANFEAQRPRLGMMPWSDYACMMNATLKNTRTTASGLVPSP